MRAYLAVLLCLAIVGVFADPPTPFWGGNPIWSVRLRVISKNTTGEPMNQTATYYYNWNIKGERYDYDDNQNDQLCKFSGVKNWEKVKCNVIYSKDGYIYIQFPSSNYCCRCTNAFGGVRYDWLQANSTYVGREVYNGITADHWYKLGNPDLGPLPNNYWATVGAQKPVRFFENSTKVNKDVIFDLSTYSTNPIDPSVFTAPANCQQQCPGQCKSLKGQTEQQGQLRTQ